MESTSNHGVNSFHSQERRRYMYAHQAFVYNINGTRYPVPPVKGMIAGEIVFVKKNSAQAASVPSCL